MFDSNNLLFVLDASSWDNLFSTSLTKFSLSDIATLSKTVLACCNWFSVSHSLISFFKDSVKVLSCLLSARATLALVLA